MKKYLTILFIGLICMLCTSCVTSTYAETSVCDEDIQIVIRYGTPYYYGSTLAYYIYDGYYFYPYRYNNSWRFHRYSKPLPPPRYHHRRPPLPHYNNGHRHLESIRSPQEITEYRDQVDIHIMIDQGKVQRDLILAAENKKGE